MKLSTGDEIIDYDGGHYVEVKLPNGVYVSIDTDGTLDILDEYPQITIADLCRIIELSKELMSIVELESI